MRIRNNNVLDLVGAQGEDISIQVEESQCVVGKTLNGPQLDAGKFTLSKDNDPSLLTISSVYSTDIGGSCRVVISGSDGGDVSIYRMIQAPNEGRDSVTYTFDVL